MRNKKAIRHKKPSRDPIIENGVGRRCKHVAVTNGVITSQSLSRRSRNTVSDHELRVLQLVRTLLVLTTLNINRTPVKAGIIRSVRGKSRRAAASVVDEVWWREERRLASHTPSEGGGPGCFGSVPKDEGWRVSRRIE